MYYLERYDILIERLSSLACMMISLTGSIHVCNIRSLCFLFLSYDLFDKECVCMEEIKLMFVFIPNCIEMFRHIRRGDPIIGERSFSM